MVAVAVAVVAVAVVAVAVVAVVAVAADVALFCYIVTEFRKCVLFCNKKVTIFTIVGRNEKLPKNRLCYTVTRISKKPCYTVTYL